MSCGTVISRQGTLPRYAHDDSNCDSSADPLNLLFEDKTSANLSGMLRATVNVDTNQAWRQPWRLGPFAAAHDQWVEITDVCVHQDEQCVTGPIWNQFHIRMWDLPNRRVIGGAHHENLLSLGGNPPGLRGHPVDAFESGKDSVCDDCLTSGKNVSRNAIFMNNYKRVPYCSGLAAYIT